MSTTDNKPTPPSTPIAKVTTAPAPKAEVKPVAKTESTPAVKPADPTKPVDTSDPKPADSVVAKVAAKENRQAGKGSKRRPFNAKIFGANYGAIQWGHGQAQRPKH